MSYEVKNKISSTLVQLTVGQHFFMKANEQQRNFKDLKKEKNNSNSLNNFYWLSSSALQNRYILINFSVFSASKLFLMLEHTKPYVEKIHYINDEPAGYVHKLDVKLQSLCGSGFSLFAVRVLAKPYHFGVN